MTSTITTTTTRKKRRREKIRSLLISVDGIKGGMYNTLIWRELASAVRRRSAMRKQFYRQRCNITVSVEKRISFRNNESQSNETGGSWTLMAISKSNRNTMLAF